MKILSEDLRVLDISEIKIDFKKLSELETNQVITQRPLRKTVSIHIFFKLKLFTFKTIILLCNQTDYSEAQRKNFV